MAHNDFENIMQSRFQEFESKPPESVWTRITNFRDRRKKRFLLLLWFLPIAAIASTTILLYSENASKASLEVIQITDNQIKNNYSSKVALESNNSVNSVEKDGKSNENSHVVSENHPSVEAALIQQPLTANKTTSQGSRSKQPLDETEAKSNETALTPPPISNKEESMQLRLSQMTPLALLPNLPSLESQIPLYDGIRSKNVYRWQKEIGIVIGSFVNLSSPTYEWSAPTPTSLFDESKSVANNEYQRFLEVSPYFQWTNAKSRFAIRSNVQLAAANISTIRNQMRYLGNQQSLGLGVGGHYYLTKNRWRVALYAQIQGESLRTKFSNDGTSPWFSNENNISPSLTQANNDPKPPAGYNQFLVSGEAGIRLEYVMPRPNWKLQIESGYRNYFWQQSIPIITNEAVIRVPQLMHFNLGISRQF